MSETASPAEPQQDAVVISSFDSYPHAEHRVAKLGWGFRKKARKGDATAVVVRGNEDGSMKVTESRVLSANQLVCVLLHVSLSWTVGFLGLFSTFKGAKSGARATHAHQRHVGSSKHRAHEVLADAGPHAAIVLIRCHEPTRQTIAAELANGASSSWDGSLSQFLASLDPGSTDDWVRAAVGVPAGANR
jgi:hypothetical protein